MCSKFCVSVTCSNTFVDYMFMDCNNRKLLTLFPKINVNIIPSSVYVTDVVQCVHIYMRNCRYSSSQ